MTCNQAYSEASLDDDIQSLFVVIVPLPPDESKDALEESRLHGGVRSKIVIDLEADSPPKLAVTEHDWSAETSPVVR